MRGPPREIPPRGPRRLGTWGSRSPRRSPRRSGRTIVAPRAAARLSSRRRSDRPHLRHASRAQGRLRCGQARDRHPEGRTAHVVEPRPVTEVDRGGIAAVLAADSEVKVLPRAPPLLTAIATSWPTPLWSRVTNGSCGKMPRSTYSRRNLPASSRENPKVICVRSFVPKEKNCASAAMSSAVRARAGHLDHRSHEIGDLHPRRRLHLFGDLARHRAWFWNSVTWPTSGIMISGKTRSPPS